MADFRKVADGLISHHRHPSFDVVSIVASTKTLTHNAGVSTNIIPAGVAAPVVLVSLPLTHSPSRPAIVSSEIEWIQLENPIPLQYRLYGLPFLGEFWMENSGLGQ